MADDRQDDGLRPGARVMISGGRHGLQTGRLIGAGERDATVELADGPVTVARSQVRAME